MDVRGGRFKRNAKFGVCFLFMLFMSLVVTSSCQGMGEPKRERPEVLALSLNVYTGREANIVLSVMSIINYEIKVQVRNDSHYNLSFSGARPLEFEQYFEGEWYQVPWRRGFTLEGAGFLPWETGIWIEDMSLYADVLQFGELYRFRMRALMRESFCDSFAELEKFDFTVEFYWE